MSSSLSEEDLEQQPLLLKPEMLATQSEGSINTENAPVSIYDIRSNRRRILILILLALSGFLLPFSDTVYLPALSNMEEDLHASISLVDNTVSIYLIVAGIFALIWGPLGDRFGRKIILLIAFALFFANTIACIFAPNIAILLIFRALQGGSISAALVVSQSAIVDMYRPQNLGRAMGLFYAPFLVGPILGPLVGGALSNRFGWRSIFVTIAIMAAVCFSTILIFIPETHHYLFVKRLSNPKKQLKNMNDKTKPITIIEANTISKPRFVPPWVLFKLLLDMTMLPHIVTTTVVFGELFMVLTLMSNRLSEEPYSLSQMMIGVCYISTGISLLIGSLVGGFLSDWSAKRIPQVTEGRFIINLFVGLTCPVGLFIFGWTFHFNIHLFAPLIGASLFAFGESSIHTALSAYINVKKRTMAGAVLSIKTSLCCIFAGVGIAIVNPLLKLMKFGPLLSLVGGISFLSIIIAIISAAYQIRRAKTPSPKNES
jgi:multidrug resistance protein